MSTTVDFDKKTFAVITGASQGIGRTLAVELARKIKHGSIVILIARSLSGLNETKNLMLEANNKVTIETLSLDLSKAQKQDYEEIFNQNLKNPKKGDFDLGIIFHNAGSVGNLNSGLEYTNIQEWHNYFEVNLFSAVILNSVFVKRVRELVNQLVVVNVTSLCGRKAFQNMGMYGSGKASRDMYFGVLALEETGLFVLNYSPGPVDTAMFHEVKDNVKNTEVRTMFTTMAEQKTFLVPLQTVTKLLSILSEGKYKSGDVIDYYDEI